MTRGLFPCEFCVRDFPRAELKPHYGGLACSKCRTTLKPSGAVHRITTIPLPKPKARA